MQWSGQSIGAAPQPQAHRPDDGRSGWTLHTNFVSSHTKQGSRLAKLDIPAFENQQAAANKFVPRLVPCGTLFTLGELLTAELRPENNLDGLTSFRGRQMTDSEAVWRDNLQNAWAALRLFVRG